ncbi:MAG TPA: hypothetical protein VFY29_15280 [Terriglobia bacterium]|nr:hypothetical protein [Terriglobia bacterium]
MNRRQFIAVAGGASAVSLITSPSASAVAADDATPLVARGLIMVSFEDPIVLRLGFPKAPGHRATVAAQSLTGSRRVINIKGKGAVEAALAGSTAFNVKTPELIRMKEFYGEGVHSRITECPSVIEIPYAAIASITTAGTSDARYAFVRADTGREVASFRPRRIAESIRIDLKRSGALKLDRGKTVLALENLKELRVDYTPDSMAPGNSTDAFTRHFHHYLAYIDRPATARFDVTPKKLGEQSVVPAAGARNLLWPITFCFMVAVP